MKATSDELPPFVSVVECGSISAAAEHLGLTPSAVSRTLSRLEEKLATTLLNRTTRRMELTEEGRFFFDSAKEILQQMEALEERLALRQQNKLPRYFTVEQFSVTVESRNDGEQMASKSRARVELMVAGEKITSSGSGNGPVNALDAALRKDLGKYSPFLADLRLVDYKVRILTSGTEAVTRVTVESADGKGNRWSTVGVSENIVDASFEALTDSIIYKLYRDKAEV